MIFIKPPKRGPLFQITPDQQKGLFLFSLLIVCILGSRYGTFLYDASRRTSSPVSDQGIIIDLQGEIDRPGLYTYRQQPTIQQVIRDGGGIASSQSLVLLEKISSLQQDTSLLFHRNGQGVTLRQEPLSLKALWILGRPIPLNRASAEDLDRLPGIGPGLAQRILEYRETRGGFSSLDDLKEVRGIKEKTFEKIKGYLTL